MADVPSSWWQGEPAPPPPIVEPEPPTEYCGHPAWTEIVQTLRAAIVAWNTRPDVIERCHVGRLACSPQPYVTVRGLSLVNQWTLKRYAGAFLAAAQDLNELGSTEPLTNELLEAAWSFALQT